MPKYMDATKRVKPKGKTVTSKVQIPTKSTAEAIRDIEKSLGNGRVLVYIQDWLIGPWDVMPIFNQLSSMGKVNNLTLILDSTGGYSDDAYKIAGIIHEFSESLTVVVPFKAKSAATLLSLAGREILMSPLAELGPCDPMIRVDESLITPRGLPVTPTEETGETRTKKRQMNALALRDFLEVAGILIRDDQGKIAGYDCNKLIPFCEKGVLNPWLLGDFERSFKQASQFVENLLRRYMFKDQPDKLELVPDITRRLAEGYYLHDYPISRREAQEMGLNVTDMPKELWKWTSELLAAYDVMKREQQLCTIIETSDSYYVDKWKST